MEASSSVFTSPALLLPLGSVKGADGFLQTGPFLETCRQVLPVVDKLGTAFALVKSDIGGNIERLARRAATDPERYTRLFTVVQDEIVAKTNNESTSCTKGLLWLKRAMEFTLAILARLQADPAAPLGTVVSETYSSTLMQFHGFFASTAFTLAFKFVPTREQFLANLGGGSSPSLMEDMQAFSASFGAVLAEVHAYLVENGLDDPTKV